MGGTSSEQPVGPDRGVQPRRAPVVPRARPADGGGEVLPLEDRALRLIGTGAAGLVNISGPPGSGRTTALQHLAAVLPPDADVGFFDHGGPPARPTARLVFFSSSGPDDHSFVRFDLVPWGDDDLIEYLVAKHRSRCQAVMFKVKSYARHLSLGGSPELWAMVLDAMAGDDSIPDVAAAMRRCVAPLLSDPKMTAGQACLTRLRAECLRGDVTDLPNPGTRLAAHRAVQLVLASELIVRNLCDGVGWADLEGKLPHDLIIETAHLAAHWSAAADRLADLVAGNKRRTHPMAASLLVAIRPDW